MDRLYHAVPSFPTLSEVWLHLVQTYRAASPAGAGGRQGEKS